MADRIRCEVVYIIDDDTSIQRALTRLMRSAGLTSVAYSSIEDFMQSGFEAERACIVADVHMPGIDALNLPAHLRQLGNDLPVIFITADDTDETRERVRQAGGAGYFRKPVDDQALLDAIHWAIGE